MSDCTSDGRMARHSALARHLVLLLLAQTTGCASCGDCGHTFFGGGEFTITLSGDIQGAARGAGLSQDELEMWVEHAGLHWADAREHYRVEGDTGGLYGRAHAGIDDGGFAGGTVVPAGTFTGCEEATFVSVYTARPTAHPCPRGGKVCPDDYPGLCYEVDVAWSLTGTVTAEERWECDRGFAGGF